MIWKSTVDAYQFGSTVELNNLHLRAFIRFFNQPHTSNASVLGGRGTLILANIEGLGSVAIKSYRRGGWISYLMKRRYLKLGKTRAQLEFEFLQYIRNLGIHAPEPVAYAHSGHIIYKAWLVSRAIKQSITLALLSLKDERRSRQVMKSVIEQILLLIQNGILHVDLHPGNIVIDGDNQIFLVDFDKGKIYQGNREKLKNRYLSRWQRAVNKHGLPNMLNEMLIEGLFKN